MTSTFLVTGGTGTLGRALVPLLRDTGRTVRVLSRHPGDPADGVEHVAADLTTGEGVDAAMDGISTILHLAGGATGDDDKARTLVRAASRAGSPHLVYVSVVGADRVPVVSRTDRAMFGYFASKRAAEQVVEDSGLPWTTLRATQFHDFVLDLVRPLAKLPVVPYFAGVSFQPVDARDVAERLVDLALGNPAGLVPDVGGPHTYEMRTLVRAYLEATGRRRALVPVRTPGRASRAYRDGANLTPSRAVGRRTWEEFLGSHTERTGGAGGSAASGVSATMAP